jgi:hypothetical protein
VEWSPAAHHVGDALPVYTRNTPCPMRYAYPDYPQRITLAVRYRYVWAWRACLLHLTRSAYVRHALWATKLFVAHVIGGALRVIR